MGNSNASLPLKNKMSKGDSMAETRVGYWYATGPADKQYTSGDPDFNLHTVISDTSQFVAHVTVENAGEQRFPVPCSLIDEIAAPPGQIYSHSEQKFVEMPKTAAV
jgi:hypothetical protein